MKVDDAELVFGKRWNNWSPEETREFVSCLEPEELNMAFTLQLALANKALLKPETLARLLHLGG